MHVRRISHCWAFSCCCLLSFSITQNSSISLNLMILSNNKMINRIVIEGRESSPERRMKQEVLETFNNYFISFFMSSFHLIANNFRPFCTRRRPQSSLDFFLDLQFYCFYWIFYSFKVKSSNKLTLFSTLYSLCCSLLDKKIWNFRWNNVDLTGDFLQWEFFQCIIFSRLFHNFEWWQNGFVNIQNFDP